MPAQGNIDGSLLTSGRDNDPMTNMHTYLHTFAPTSTGLVEYAIREKDLMARTNRNLRSGLDHIVILQLL